MASRALLASLLLSLLVASYATDVFELGPAQGRALMKKKSKSKGKGSSLSPKEKAAREEAKREAKALADYERAKEKREKEKVQVIKAARKEAMAEFERFNKADTEKARTQLFVNLWKNAKGPTILILLTTLVDSSVEFAPVYMDICAASMLDAERKGFSFQVADALWAAIVLVENDGDGDLLLDIVLQNVRGKNRSEKQSGCIYVKNLLTDAETLAGESGYELEFAQSIDNEDYLALTECFYDECEEKDVVACCADEDIILSGRCGCLKKGPETCKFNLFFNTPRHIWRCTGEDCPSPKCLCPEIKSKKGKKASKSKGGNGDKKSKVKSKNKSGSKKKAAKGRRT